MTEGFGVTLRLQTSAGSLSVNCAERQFQTWKISEKHMANGTRNCVVRLMKQKRWDRRETWKVLKAQLKNLKLD